MAEASAGACALVGISRPSYRYPPRVRDDSLLHQRLRTLARQCPRDGSPKLTVFIRGELGPSITKEGGGYMCRNDSSCPGADA